MKRNKYGQPRTVQTYGLPNIPLAGQTQEIPDTYDMINGKKVLREYG